MEKLKKSPAEILKEVVIKPIEQECLNRVFKYISKHLQHHNHFLASKGRFRYWRWLWPFTYETVTVIKIWIVANDFYVDKTKSAENSDKIGALDLARVLQFLGQKPSKSEVNLIIWEVDDDLD